jgi:nucleoside-diphosphate-sugar epimerase
VKALKVLVTGGAGFIGRWVVKRLLDDGHDVWALDDLSNGRLANIVEFEGQVGWRGFSRGDIKDMALLEKLFQNRFDLCYHMGASINVQDSIDEPRQTFDNDVIGTFNVLELCRRYNVKMVFMSTCMVYDRATDPAGINELHPTKPASPYAGSKIAGENMVLSYWYAFGLPTVVVRPFNTYGPFQKTGGEGGVVAIFIKKALAGEALQIYGSGEQTRDLLYVTDCARFVVEAGYSDKVNGQVLNAGLGQDISVNDLAALVEPDLTKIIHVPHIHPQSEIMKLLCDSRKAKELLDWAPAVSLEQGLKLTREWIAKNSALV